MDLVAAEFGLLAIDHEDHVGDTLGGSIDDQSFRGNLLLGAEGVGIRIGGGSGRSGSVENEFDRNISPFLGY